MIELTHKNIDINVYLDITSANAGILDWRSDNISKRLASFSPVDARNLQNIYRAMRDVTFNDMA